MASSYSFLRRLGRRRQRWYLWNPPLVHACLLAVIVTGLLHSWRLPQYFPSTPFHGRAQLAGGLVIRPVVGSGTVHAGRLMVVPVSPLTTSAGRLEALLLRIAPWTAPAVLKVDVSYAGRWAAPDAGIRAGWRYALVASHGACGARGALQVDVHFFGVARPTIVAPPCPAAQAPLPFAPPD